ncbi:MAG TPA: hypothetical protein VKX17_27000 [Planctomycetota bacterium]|nr:hypothetical protein [Planctomycetota bacterium]
MTAKKLRAIRDASPFIPFTIYLKDGQVFRVPAADYFSVSPSGRMVVVCGPTDAFNMLELTWIRRIAVDKIHKRKSNGR